MARPDAKGKCVMAEHIYGGALMTGVENPPVGTYLIKGTFLIRGPENLKNTVTIETHLYGEQNRELSHSRFSAVTTPQKEWKTISTFVDVPQESAGQKVKRLSFGSRFRGMTEGQVLHVGDLAVYPITRETK